MPDNITLRRGDGGEILATDEISGIHFQEVKIGHGPDGEYLGTDSNNPLPVHLYSSAFGDARVAESTPVVSLQFPYNINTEMVSTSTTGSGTATQSNSKLVLQTTAASSSSSEMLSRRFLHYSPGQGATVRFTALFTTGVSNSEQIIGIGDSDDGFFFGYNGATFSILRRSNGSDNWVAQTAWSEDKADNTGTLPTLDQTKGNVFQICYQWLGFGLVSFAIENPSNGKFVTVHKIEYANSATDPTVFNPSLPLCARVENTTNTSNIKLETASMCAMIDGRVVFLGPKFSISNNKSAVGTTQTNIFTIRNKSTFQSKTNRVFIKLEIMSFSTDGNKPCELRVTKNATLGGTPAYTDINATGSVIEYDTAGTTVTGGQRVFTIATGKTDSRDRDLYDYDVELFPGESLTFSGAANSATSDISMSVAWIEVV